MFCPDTSETDLQDIARQIMAVYDDRGPGEGGSKSGETCLVRDKESSGEKRTGTQDEKSSLS